MRFGLDLDGCIVNFNAAYAAKFRDRGYDVPDYSQPGLHPPTWDYPQHAFGVPVEVVNEVWKDIQADPHFWEHLPPYTECDEHFFDFLNNLQDEGHEITFLTLRAGEYARQQTISALWRYGMMDPQVTLTPRGKGQLAYWLDLDVVVDDYPHMLNEYSMLKYATDRFPTIYRIERPYNAECDHGNIVVVKTMRQAIEHALTVDNITHARKEAA